MVGVRRRVAAWFGVLLLAGCTADEPLHCDPCLSSGAYLTIEGRLPRPPSYHAPPFTVRACLVDRDLGVPCAKVAYERCRPNRECGNPMSNDVAPGAAPTPWIFMTQLSLEIGDLEPRELEGHTVVVTVEIHGKRGTSSAVLDYGVGSSCCDGSSFATARVRFTERVS